MGAQATSPARCGRGGEEVGVAAAESTEKVEERPATLAVLLLLAELTLELELGAAVVESAMSGRYGAGWSMAALGGLGGVDEEEAAGAAII
jgi:hypothetical protein